MPTRGPVGFAVFAILCWMAAGNWDGSVGEVSASLLHWQLFIVGYLAAAFVHISVWTLAPRWPSKGERLIWLSVIVSSLLVGLAVGTTDWEAWTMSRWWQFWWTCPLVVASAVQIKQLHKAQSAGAEPLQGDDGRANGTVRKQREHQARFSHR